VHSALKGFFSDQFRKKGFEMLGWAEVGNVHLFSKNPIRNINDLSRQKIWTWSGDPIAKTTFSMMGINPIPLSITDVTTALNTGMINTVYAPPLGAIALQWNQYLNYMTTLPLTHSTGAVLLSKKIFGQTPENLSGMLMIESEKVMAELMKDLRIQTEESVKFLEKGGLKRLPMPDDPELEEFMRVHEKVAQSLSGKVYPPELLERVYGLLRREQN
jgi:TRAP-type C4-dicarboxylate transport system substrate-binding protein